MSTQNNNSSASTTFEVGDVVEVQPERVAHGGAMVARVNGRVVFVRHGVIGESARARITKIGPKGRFFFADVIEVLEPSANRREHPWQPANALTAAQAGQEPLGGMEFAHVEPAMQREYKADVVREQLVRLGGMDSADQLLSELTVQEVPGGDLGVRTRAHFAVTDEGRLAMYPFHSSTPRVIENFPLMVAPLQELNLAQVVMKGVKRVDVASSSTGETFIQCTIADGKTPEELAERLDWEFSRVLGELVPQKISLLLTPERKAGRGPGKRPADILLGSPTVHEKFYVRGTEFEYEISGNGFWQNHKDAPRSLCTVVDDFAEFQEGQTVFDLYAGAGLFTAIAAHAVGPEGYVLSVEGSALTNADAQRNFAIGGVSRTERSAETEINIRRGDVSRTLEQLKRSKDARAAHPDTVILDPSREGAGQKVMQQVAELAPQKIIYVACDPASLGRDAGYLRELGWTPARIEAFDLYPNTHHVETVVLFTR